MNTPHNLFEISFWIKQLDFFWLFLLLDLYFEINEESENSFTLFVIINKFTIVHCSFISLHSLSTLFAIYEIAFIIIIHFFVFYCYLSFAIKFSVSKESWKLFVSGKDSSLSVQDDVDIFDDAGTDGGSGGDWKFRLI